jgi:hypothetical protein
VQGLSSAQFSIAPAAQTPAAQVSPTEQALSSLQLAVFASNLQPTKGSQVSLVHGLASLHSILAPGAHCPAVQVSPTVHKLPSSHGPGAGEKTQPLTPRQPSLVHELSSLQMIHPPAQVPPAHTSPLVQALPSLQGAELFTKAQPVIASQLSVVQTFPSLQTLGWPG